MSMQARHCSGAAPPGRHKLRRRARTGSSGNSGGPDLSLQTLDFLEQVDHQGGQFRHGIEG